MKVLEFKDVWEKYHIKFIQKGKVFWEEFWVLEDIKFSVNKGQVIGIIGENGAGKTTILKLIAGMLVPDRGEVYISGKVSALMELGAGFNPEFTGRENIILNARMYGLTEKALDQQMNGVIEFAGLGRFIDAPIKYYSQGMYMRLAFALAIYVDPEILLIDDILAVGDEEAQQKCIKKIFQLKQDGRTIVVVSHNMNMIARLCDQVILLEKGKIVQRGLPHEVTSRYLEMVGDKKGIGVLEKEKLRVVFNNGRIIISYDGVTLTKGMGGYVSFFIPTLNAWSSSFNLNWQIMNSQPNEIIAEGLHQDGTIAQAWVIQVQEDQLQWQVELKDGSIKETHIDLLLMPEYKRWVSLEKDGEFGPSIHKFNWQEIGWDSFQDNVLGIKANLEKGDFPALILKIDNKDSELKLLNTGYEQEARLIQSSLVEGNYISMKVKIFSNIDIFEDYIKQLRKDLFLKQQHEQALLRKPRSLEESNLRLFADLGTKSLRLYYKDKEITKSSGLHISFLLNQTWYDTSSCDWEVERQGDTLILKLSWKQPLFSSTWRLSLEGNCLNWQAESKSLDLEIVKFGLTTIPKYSSFFAAHQQGNFPKQFTSCQDMHLEEPKAELFGLRKQSGLPAIVFDNKQRFFCLIQTSNVQSLCRTLQLSISNQVLKENKDFSFSTRLRILEDEAMINDYIKQEQDKLLLRQREEQARIHASCTIISDRLRLFADLEARCLRLYYKNRELTAAYGLHFSFNNLKESFGLFNAQWKIQKLSEERLILSLEYEQFPGKQIWDLRCNSDDTLEIKAELKVNKQTFLIDEGIRLELTEEYKRWITPNEEGNFLINRYIDNIGPIRLKDNKISDIILKPEYKEYIPDLIFNCYSQSENRILNIYKRKEKDVSCVGVYSAVITSKRKQVVLPGKYTYFQGKVILGRRIKLEKLVRKINTIELRYDNLGFIFDRGKGNIFWKEKELTSGLGVYSSVRSSGIWYDSYQAAWQVIQRTKSKIVTVGDWPHIPISQTWQVELLEENLTYWKVDIEIHEEINLEIEQANLMLSSEYKTWIVPGVNKGGFLDEYTQDYDILPFRFWYGTAPKEGVGVINKDLPGIFLKCNLEDKYYRTIIENTDSLYQARLLQYQKSNTDKISPKKYIYFEGIIRIAPKVNC